MRLLQDDKIPDTGGSFLEKIKKAIHNDFKYTCCIAALYGIGLSLFHYNDTQVLASIALSQAVSVLLKARKI
jgi:hypothetical protein